MCQFSTHMLVNVTCYSIYIYLFYIVDTTESGITFTEEFSHAGTVNFNLKYKHYLGLWEKKTLVKLKTKRK